MHRQYTPPREAVRKRVKGMADFDASLSEIDPIAFDSIDGAGRARTLAGIGGTFMKLRWLGAFGFPLLVLAGPSIPASAQTAPGPFARIGIMRAIDGHAVELDAGYIRHLDWHRRVKDPFRWYGYSVWASTERQGWIIYATFGHAAASLNDPIAPGDDVRDSVVNLVPHAQFLGQWIYEFLPALSRGNSQGVPTATLQAEYTTVELNQGAGKAFEAALAAEQAGLQGETLWYRMVVGDTSPRYVRLRPRPSLAAVLDERADQALPDKVSGLVAKVTVETLNLRPDLLVNVTPASPR